MKLNTCIASVTLIIWLLVSKIGNLSLLETINLTFLVAIISLLIYAVIIIVESKFLDLFVNGFKNVNYLLFPQSRASKRAEKLVDNDQKLNEWKLSVQGISKRLAAVISVTTLSTSLICLAVDYWIL